MTGRPKLPSGFRRLDPERVDRMWKEMTTNLAPADTGLVVTPRRPLKRRFVHGDR